MFKEVCIAVIAHNQEKLVLQEIKNISLFYKKESYRLVIVDNGSSDLLAQWLKSQDEIDYILCEGGIENYAAILNTVVLEFAGDDDLLVLSPHLLVLPECIVRMRQALERGEAAGAICAKTILAGSGTTEGKDFKAASAYAEKAAFECLEMISLETGAFLIRSECLQKTGSFDENLLLPENVMMDYSFRIIKEGFRIYRACNACMYQMVQAAGCYTQKYGADIDRAALKEKWGMNYFNQYPNWNLLSLIKRRKTEAFSVLEVGCDCGVNLLQVKNEYPNAHLCGMEINPNAAAIASHIAQVYTGNIEEEIPDFDCLLFDYIVFGDVLEHLKDPEKVLCECAKRLKPGGQVVACIPNLMHYSVIHGLLHGNFTYTDMGLLDRTHIHFFTYNEILRMFERAGFSMDTVLSVGRKEEAPAEVRQFVQGLLDLAGEKEEFMYYTFQYVVAASKKKDRMKKPADLKMRCKDA